MAENSNKITTDEVIAGLAVLLAGGAGIRNAHGGKFNVAKITRHVFSLLSPAERKILGMSEVQFHSRIARAIRVTHERQAENG